MTTIINGSSPSITFSDGSAQTSATRPFQNRLINGNMVIDQRNAGGSVSITTGNQYTLDRWQAYNTQASKYTIQQNAGSVTPPSGFINYLGVTSSSAYSITSGDVFGPAQYIEGLNVADLNWGTANAQTVTLSFWVRSSLTGTFGGSLQNNAGNRTYPFSYTISSANTWEYKTITIAGDTTGTWLTTNGTGIRLFFSIGTGSSVSGTAGAWTSSTVYSATGATSVVGTNGATFYITGVQLEVGSTATSFDYRPYGTELALCQRYYETSFNLGTTPQAGIALGNSSGHNVTSYGATASRSGNIPFAVSKRTAPAITFYRTSLSASNDSSWQWFNGSAWTNAATATVIVTATCQSFQAEVTSASMTSNYSYIAAGNWAASSEL